MATDGPIDEQIERTRLALNRWVATREEAAGEELVVLARAYVHAVAPPTDGLAALSTARRDEVIRDAVQSFLEDLDDDPAPPSPERLLRRAVTNIRHERLQAAIDHWRREGGTASARKALIELAVEDLRRIAGYLGAGPGGPVRVTEVVNQAMVILLQKLEAEKTPTAAQFLAFAGTCIRWTFFDLLQKERNQPGPLPERTDPGSAGAEPAVLDPSGSSFHPSKVLLADELRAALDRLSDEENRVVDLLFFQSLSQHSAAAALGISVYLVEKKWAAIQRKLGRFFKDWSGDL
jgi:RNA polymerase sigma factor (sigma-70 family)